jgi:hypothetical protein
MLKDNGRLGLVPIGHMSARAAEYCRCTIFTEKARSAARSCRSRHPATRSTRRSTRSRSAWPHIEVRIDADCYDRKTVEALGIHIGDAVAIDPGTRVHGQWLHRLAPSRRQSGLRGDARALKAMIDGQVRTPVVYPHHLHDQRGDPAPAHRRCCSKMWSRWSRSTTAPPRPDRIAPNRRDRRHGRPGGPFDYHLTRKLIRFARITAFATSATSSAIPFRQRLALEGGADVRTALITFGIDASHGMSASTCTR